MKYIDNPILTGFNPDPSIIRVENDFYIATSTFEWFPGVQIHHSRDLQNWELIARPLERLSQLNMKGNAASAGVWAPCLSYHDGTYYLVYTDMKQKDGRWRDLHNYLVTSEDITGNWSEPVYLNSSGIDPSLFHDPEGEKWLVNMIWDHRQQHTFAGIILQEYLPEEQKLTGPIKNIFEGTELGYTEGPHLYKRNGYYYLITAEGGTGYGHAVTMARSRQIDGPYRVHPHNPVLTSRDNSGLELQKAGHADIVETQNGEWYLVHLCGRPLEERGRCTLGRETAIQKMVWREDWLYAEEGGNQPRLRVPAPDLPEEKPVVDKQKKYYDFSGDSLDIDFQSLRVPLDEDTLSLKDRPGYLRLKGHESPSSRFQQSLVARRWKHFRFEAETCVEFSPQSFQQMAGLICYYDELDFYYLRITHNKEAGNTLGIISCVNGDYDVEAAPEIDISACEQIYLKVKVDFDQLQFYYAKDGDSWEKIGSLLDAGKLSDEEAVGCFTGAFVGLCCQDLSGRNQYADFEYFSYEVAED